jgi:hypothetical protein
MLVSDIMTKAAGISEIVRVVDLDEIPVRDGPPLRFRIEIIRTKRGSYSPRAWRYEMFRQRPLVKGPRGAGQTESHETILVEDTQLPWSEIKSTTVKAALSRAFRLLEDQLLIRIRIR